MGTLSMITGSLVSTFYVAVLWPILRWRWWYMHCGWRWGWLSWCTTAFMLHPADNSTPWVLYSGKYLAAALLVVCHDSNPVLLCTSSIHIICTCILAYRITVEKCIIHLKTLQLVRHLQVSQVFSLYLSVPGLLIHVLTCLLQTLLVVD